MSNFFIDPAQKRLVLLPIRHPTLWEIFKEQQSVLWTTEEIDWAGDVKAVSYTHLTLPTTPYV